MATTIETLPDEVLLNIARQQDQRTRLAIASTSPRLQRIGVETLYEDSIVTSVACQHPQVTNPPRACYHQVLQYLWRLMQTGVQSRSLTLRTDFSPRAVGTDFHYGDLEVTTKHDIRYYQNNHFFSFVQTIFPNRPQHDWLADLHDCLYEDYSTVALVHSARLEELRLEPYAADADCALPITYVMSEIMNNNASMATNPDPPLHRLRLLEVGRSMVPSPLDCFVYGVNLDYVPHLQEAYFSFGTPLVVSNHNNLTKLKLEHWACRTISIGELPPTPPVWTMTGTSPHLEAHRHLIRLPAHLPDLKHFEVTNCRACDHLLTGYEYQDINDELIRRIHGLPKTMRRCSTKLRVFKMTTKIFPAGQNGGMWLFRGYHHHFGTWTGYHHLEELEMDSWFFFLGRPVPQPGLPIVTAHPSVLLTELGDSVKKITILNLANGYHGQFYQFLERVLSEKQMGGLAGLGEIAYTTLVPGAVFPPAGSPRTLAEMKADLAAQGVTLV